MTLKTINLTQNEVDGDGAGLVTGSGTSIWSCTFGHFLRCAGRSVVNVAREPQVPYNIFMPPWPEMNTCVFLWNRVSDAVLKCNRVGIRIHECLFFNNEGEDLLLVSPTRNYREYGLQVQTCLFSRSLTTIDGVNVWNIGNVGNTTTQTWRLTATPMELCLVSISASQAMGPTQANASRPFSNSAWLEEHQHNLESAGALDSAAAEVGFPSWAGGLIGVAVAIAAIGIGIIVLLRWRKSEYEYTTDESLGPAPHSNSGAYANFNKRVEQQENAAVSWINPLNENEEEVAKNIASVEPVEVELMIPLDD
jgi:hypothetical protein